MLCGLASGFPELVAFRTLQGLLGAPIVPLAQALLFDINPPERHGRAMGSFGMAMVISPIMGPMLGGWIGEHTTWRWVFWINLPLGLLAFAGLWLFLGRTTSDVRRRFDFLGYAALALALAAFQLMLDRGPSQDWFDSREIWIEAALAAGAFWVF